MTGLASAKCVPLVCHFLLDRSLVHPCQPRACIERPDAFSKKHERDDSEVVGEEHCSEDSRDDHCVSTFQDPVEQIYAKSEADQLLANAHGYKHLRCVCGVWEECRH